MCLRTCTGFTSLVQDIYQEYDPQSDIQEAQIVSLSIINSKNWGFNCQDILILEIRNWRWTGFILYIGIHNEIIHNSFNITTRVISSM